MAWRGVARRGAQRGGGAWVLGATSEDPRTSARAECDHLRSVNRLGRLNWIRFGSVRFSSVQFGSVRLARRRRGAPRRSTSTWRPGGLAAWRPMIGKYGEHQCARKWFKINERKWASGVFPVSLVEAAAPRAARAGRAAPPPRATSRAARAPAARTCVRTIIGTGHPALRNRAIEELCLICPVVI